jgi:taurine dioxygenase
MAVEVSVLPGFGGAEVHDLDLRNELDEATQEQIRELFAKHRLLVFHDQELEREDQIRFVSICGPVADEFGDGSSTSMVSNLDPDAFLTITDRLYFHSDRTYTPYPLLALCLYGVDISSDVTPTRYVSLEGALRRLPPDLRRRIINMVATDMADYSNSGNPDVRPLRLRLPDDLPLLAFPRQMRPLVATHPVTLDPALSVGEFQTVWIDGLSREESDALLEELYGYIYDPAYVYEHHWRQKDLVIWDNVALQHGRDPLTPTERREMRRVCIGYHGWEDFFAGVRAGYDAEGVVESLDADVVRA